MNISGLKLGAFPSSPDEMRRNLMFAKYGAALPPAYPSVDWTRGKTEWGMLGNDKRGNCTCATVAHMTQVYCLNSWGEVLVTEEQVNGYYARWCGWDPANPDVTDRGGNPLDVLTQWRKEGFGVPGRPPHEMLAFVQADQKNLEHVRQAMSFFGPTYTAIALPASAQAQTGPGKVWEGKHKRFRPDTQPWSWGGHAANTVIFTADGPAVITWGFIQRMTWEFWAHYVIEAYPILHKGWYPPGFDMPTLYADLEAIAA